jgi:hypothetical protein
MIISIPKMCPRIAQSFTNLIGCILIGMSSDSMAISRRVLLREMGKIQGIEKLSYSSISKTTRSPSIRKNLKIQESPKVNSSRKKNT